MHFNLDWDWRWKLMFALRSASQFSASFSPQTARPQKVRQQKSRVKTICITFFNSKGIVYDEYQTVNAQFYLSVLKWLMTSTCHVSRNIVKPRIGDCYTTMQNHIQRTLFNSKSRKINYRTSSFTLFTRFGIPWFLPILKIKLEVQRTFFQDVKTIKATATRHRKVTFSPTSIYLHSCQSLYWRAQECITIERNYVCWSLVQFSRINFTFGIRKIFCAGTLYIL